MKLGTNGQKNGEGGGAVRARTSQLRAALPLTRGDQLMRLTVFLGFSDSLSAILDDMDGVIWFM